MSPNIQFVRGGLSASECVTEAWELVKRRYWMYVGAALITFIISQYLYCISWFVIGPMLGGFYLMVLKDRRGEPVDFGMIFKGFERFVPLMVAGLLYAVPQVIGQVIGFAFNFSSFFMQQPATRGGKPDLSAVWAILGAFAGVFAVLMIVSLIWYVVFMFVIQLTAEHGLPIMEAVSLSARASFANLGFVIVTAILLSLVMLLGAIMCGVGVIFVSLPVLYVTNTLAYRMVFPEISDDPNRYTPPPPSEYGDLATVQF